MRDEEGAKTTWLSTDTLGTVCEALNFNHAGAVVVSLKHVSEHMDQRVQGYTVGKYIAKQVGTSGVTWQGFPCWSVDVSHLRLLLKCRFWVRSCRGDWDSVFLNSFQGISILVIPRPHFEWQFSGYNECLGARLRFVPCSPTCFLWDLGRALYTFFGF